MKSSKIIILSLMLWNNLSSTVGTIPDGATPLICAACNGHTNAMEILIKAGANTNVIDACESTALIWAAEKGYKAAVDILITNGANVDFQDGYGETALTWSIRNEYKEIMAALIAAGADVNVQNKYGNNALMIASGDVINTIIAAGANIHARNLGGYTALASSVWNRCTDDVAILMNARGTTDEDISEALASARNRSAIHIALVNMQNDDRDTNCAKEDRSDPIVEILTSEAKKRKIYVDQPLKEIKLEKLCKSISQ